MNNRKSAGTGRGRLAEDGEVVDERTGRRATSGRARHVPDRRRALRRGRRKRRDAGVVRLARGQPGCALRERATQLAEGGKTRHTRNGARHAHLAICVHISGTISKTPHTAHLTPRKRRERWEGKRIILVEKMLDVLELLMVDGGSRTMAQGKTSESR